MLLSLQPDTSCDLAPSLPTRGTCEPRSPGAEPSPPPGQRAPGRRCQHLAPPLGTAASARRVYTVPGAAADPPRAARGSDSLPVATGSVCSFCSPAFGARGYPGCRGRSGDGQRVG